MRLQEMIKYEKRASARPTFNIFKSDFPFLTDHVRPSGTQNNNKNAIEYSARKIIDIKVLKATK